MHLRESFNTAMGAATKRKNEVLTAAGMRAVGTIEDMRGGSIADAFIFVDIAGGQLKEINYIDAHGDVWCKSTWGDEFYSAGNWVTVYAK